MTQNWHQPRIWMGGLAALALFAFWFTSGAFERLPARVPVPSDEAGLHAGERRNPVLDGVLTAGLGKRSAVEAAWPQFRGPARDGKSERAEINSGGKPDWQSAPPRLLWLVEVGEGYAGPAIWEGAVYLLDYDREKQADALRCLSLDDGAELWRFSYPVTVKRNHGMSRTTPAVGDASVVAIGPKCHVACLDAKTGELKWGKDMASEYGTVVPEWYAGQCPLILGDLVVLAPAGPEVLMVALDIETGEEIWRAPNSRGWGMSHSSVMPAHVGGRDVLVYSASGGVAVLSTEGALLWETQDWKISIATVPSPVVADGGKFFFSGGYNAGSALFELSIDGERGAGREVYRQPASQFGATQHSPIVRDGHVYGIRADGKLVCLELETGAVKWAGPEPNFGLGPFLMDGDMIYALTDKGVLCLIEATPDEYKLLGRAVVMDGHEAWGPMALAGGRLLARDLTRLICLQVTSP